ncbi:MAG: adenylate/guanylate cyclase domain-containing protein, partial [Acidobacteriota bacterium]
ADAKFCLRCGQPISAPPAVQSRFTSPETYTPKHLAEKILNSKDALEGERKQVTVLFADLKGSMELLADRDPEEAQKILDPVLEHMMEAVHRYEGTVNQVMGDGIMALFGAPLAHEDHAVRACYAALTMQESVKQYAERVQRSEGIPIQIRIGMNSGEVVVRSIGGDLRMDYTAVGQTTHLAARMEQMAMPGSILVTGDTLRLAEGYVQIKSLGPVNVKGLSAPVEVCEVTGAGPVRSRLKAAAERGLTRFVGRDPELETIRQALDKAGNGQGQVVALVGEPGVGKSRLFWEFTHSRRTVDWLIVEGGSVSYGKATAYLPIKDLLKEYFSIEGRDDARKIREKVTGKLLTLDESLKPTLPAFLMLLDISVEDQQWQNLDPPQRRQRILEAIKRLLLRESQVQPLLLVIEDLHWIDSETQSFLENFIESIPTAQILLLVNYRPEYQHGWGSKTYYSQLRLDPLPPESAGELLEAMLGNDPALQSLQRLLIERTEGNPFFLEESVRTLVERKVLVGERRNYRLSGPIENIQVPATVQAVLAARIDRLQPEEKRLLQSAAVIGKDVPFVLLQAIADQSDEELRRNLNRLQAGEFLYETSLFPDLEYTFKHALTQEVAYNSVLMERRRVLHERTAQAIEGLYQARLEEHYSHLAYHYSRSGTTQKAVEYLKLAGQQAVQRSANAEAISYFTSALELLKTLPTSPERVQQELTLQIAMGVPLVATKGHGSPEVEKAYTRARELCQQVGETPQLFPALVGLYRYYNLRAELRTSRELAEQIMSLARNTQDPALLLQAHRALGETLLWRGEIAESQTNLEQAIVLYNPQKHHSHAFLYGVDPGVYSLTYSAFGLWLLGYPDQALKRMQKAITLARSLSHPVSLGFVLAHRVRIHQYRREIPAVQELTEALTELGNEHGFPVWLALGTILRGWAMAEQEQTAEGIATMRQGLDAWRKLGVELVRPFNLTLLAEACGKAGQIEEGL